MPLVSLDRLHLSFGQRVIFDELSFAIERGERVGLIGDNGAGKTTLFKTLAGTQTVDRGSVNVGRTVKIGYLTQDPVFSGGQTVIDEAEDAFKELHDLAHRMRDLEHDMAEHQGEDLEKVFEDYEKVRHAFEDAGGYAWRHRLEAVLIGVGLPEPTWELKVDKLSGGQRSRLALAKVLINEPDLLLLDEPTNHLDLQAIAWLEETLETFPGAVLLISHDRYLLDRVATRIVWLTRAELRSYPGNYSAFTEQRKLQELTQQREYEKQQAHIAKQQEFIRRFSAGQRAAEAQGRSKILNRLLKSDAMIDRVQQSKAMHLKLGVDQRAGDQVLRVAELKKSFDGRVLWDEVEFAVRRGERIGIIGPNGSGKTTMLRTLLGEFDADAGDIRWGASLKIGYYDQRLDDFDADATILDTIVNGRDGVTDKMLRDTLALMLFSGDDVEKHMGMLSGGERARVALAQLLLDQPNVLLLDEPTNHLDIASSEALENALRGYDGTILCVSHDRYFLEQIVTRLLVIEPPAVTDFDGKLSAWTSKSAGRKAEKKPEPKKAEPKKAESKKPEPARPIATTAKKDNPFKRPYGRLTVQQLESQIADAERQIATWQDELAGPKAARDADAARKLKAKLDQGRSTLEALEAEYLLRVD
jgi:ATP-binding cassette, subfamily F, member 3